MENKNTIIALVLMLAVWFGYSVLFPPQPPDRQPAVGTEQGVATAERSSAEEEIAAPAEERSLRDYQPATERDAEERRLVIETDDYRAVFTSNGARLVSLKTKKYNETEDADSPLVSLIDVSRDDLGSLRITGTEGIGVPADLPYTISTEEQTVRLTGEQRRQVVFTGDTSAGLTVEKVFTFFGNGYDFKLDVKIFNRGPSATRGSLILSLVQPWDESMDEKFQFVGPVTMVGEDVNTDSVDDIEESARTYTSAVWTGFETKYFISASIPLENAAERIQIEKDGETVVNNLVSSYLTLESGEMSNLNYLLYFGPRDLDILKEVNYQLDEAIDFGFFSFIALPLRHVLTFFYGYVANYGVAIILLTVIIKILFWPLTHKSYSSMKAMQKLQPEMQKVREKHKNDREKLNKELMELYKTHRVNPLGGCLPMLVQIPVFFALYKVLLGDIALRHAPFMLWISDLSAKDPYYVTPILMGATMFLQQKMTPTTMDPMQAKMFMIMPVVFTFLFLNFPAGLVIYWLTNNILTIAQQMLINRKV